MIEGIEQLCEPERVFGENREFQRSDHLFDHVGSKRGQLRLPVQELLPGRIGALEMSLQRFAVVLVRLQKPR